MRTEILCHSSDNHTIHACIHGISWNQLGMEPHAAIGVYIHRILPPLHVLNVLDIYADCIHILCPDSLPHLAISCKKFDEGHFLEAGANAYGTLNQFHAWGSCGTM